MSSFNISEIKSLATEELLQTPLVQYLVGIIQKQDAEIEALKAEIRALKGHPKKPTIKPSRVENPANNNEDEGDAEQGSSEKKAKTKELQIHKEVTIEPEGVQEDWTYKGHHDFVIQDIVWQGENTRYRLEKYITSEGKYVTATLPEELQGCHFGPVLRKYVLVQHYDCHVTQPLLLQQLREMGVEISSGELSNLLIKGKELFHQEKEAILTKALSVCSYIQTDDTGARHNGKNGYCTVICNDLFTYFKSTGSKSRINFLEILRTPSYEDYYLNADAYAYMEKQGLPDKYKALLKCFGAEVFKDKTSFDGYLQSIGIKEEHAIRGITEAALFGSIIVHGVNKNMSILSDDAGQFNLLVLLHALCWIHTERNMQKVICYTDGQRKLLEEKLESFWDLYQQLKCYKQSPSNEKREQINEAFDTLFTPETGIMALNEALRHAARNKKELLAVLDNPLIPLHNNTSERDIREYVKKRKISGSTRSEEGRKCRDTFASLKKTCRKLGISFCHYLDDRIRKLNQIPLLELLIQTQSVTLSST